MRSFSGYGRAVWLFPAPMWVGDNRYRESLMKAILRDLRPKGLFAGFEEAETVDPAKCFEAGTWVVVTGQPLPQHKLDSWAFSVAEKHNWGRCTIPLDTIREECRKRFPNTWPGGWDTFTLGARGTRFWDPAGNAMSVVVRDGGCVCYTGDKPFLPWGEILGLDFVKASQSEVIGKAVEDIYWEVDCNKYWRNGTNTGLQAIGKDDIRLHLRSKGLSDMTDKNTPMSEVERAVLTIQQTKAVHFSAPILFSQERVVRVHNLEILNTNRAIAMQPYPEAAPYGERFPWLGKFYDAFLPDRVARDRFFAWFKHFYVSALAGAPEQGQAVMISGDTGCGKTWQNEVVFAHVFGSAVDATRYLMGEDQFSGSLIESPVWAMDDTVVQDSPAKRATFSQTVKQAVANNYLFLRRMYREGRNIPWSGRIIITTNLDAESLKLVPDLERGMADKVSMYRVHRPALTWASEQEVLAELPHFLAWLRAVKLDVPEDARFGVASYHDPELRQVAKDASATYNFMELCDLWRHRFFKDPAHSDMEMWSGTPTEFIEELHNMQGLESVVRACVKSQSQVVSLGRQLAKAEVPWFASGRSHKGRVWRFTKPGVEIPEEPY
jgi:hypothetical protein